MSAGDGDRNFGFTYHVLKDGRIEIRRGNVLAATLRGQPTAKFLNAASSGEDALQRLVARVTGNYRRGNERKAKGHPRNSC